MWANAGYRLLSCLMLPVWVIHAAWMALKYRCADYFWQRLGVYHQNPAPPAIWIHAASVGEVALIQPLAEALARQHRVIVSCFTITGYQQALKVLGDDIDVIVLPIDCWLISRSFIHRFAFRLALIAETELWPETLYQAARSGIPLMQINARLSAKTLSTTGCKRAILQRTLGYFDRFLTRSEDDSRKLQSMGVAAQRISVCGNLKYAEQAQVDEQFTDLIGRPYILFASTHAPEEQLFAELLHSIPSPSLLVIAPRHPRRAEEIMRQLKALSLNVSQRSRQQAIDAQTQVYLADTLGEMKPLMAHAQLVVMGGSFNAVGGHNILEPARLGCAIITGPSDDNIRPDIELLQSNQAIVQVASGDELLDAIKHLLKSETARQALGLNAAKLMQDQGQILDRYLEEIETLITR